MLHDPRIRLLQGQRSRSSAASLGAVLALAMVAAAPARAATPLGLTSCGPAQGVWQCSGLATTWDGVPLDTTVTLPAAGGAHLPLVVEIHGFGNSKYEYLDPGSTAYTDNAQADLTHEFEVEASGTHYLKVFNAENSTMASQLTVTVQ